MKSAPSSGVATTMQGSGFNTKLRKGSGVAKKSALMSAKKVVPRETDTPVSEQGSVETGKGERVLGTPISPVQLNGVLRYPRIPSPLPTERPSDPGGSQQYSLRLILTSGDERNDADVTESALSGYEFSTPYPIPLSRAVQRPVSASPSCSSSMDKGNFNILSLIPSQAVPIIEDGKLAFREGTIDSRTGQLKRGARKFKVGKFIAGEIL
jgi:hypothetical protein